MSEKLLPEGFSLSQFEEAIAELEDILGRGRVFTDDLNELRAYRDVYATTADELHMPSAAIAPESVEEIQKILAVARKFLYRCGRFQPVRISPMVVPLPAKPGTLFLI